MLRIFRLTLVLVLLLVLTAAKRPRRDSAAPSAFDYYLLVLSYAPDFCDQPTGYKDPRECAAGRKVGFVVHGLWPQGENSRGPQNCGSSPVPVRIVNQMLAYIPGSSLIQHEWKAHGSCSGMSADDYFAAIRKARDAVKIPEELEPASQIILSPAQIQAKLATANPSLPAAAFRTTCYPNRELQEVRICLDKSFRGRACGVSAGQCTLPQVTLQPLR